MLSLSADSRIDVGSFRECLASNQQKITPTFSNPFLSQIRGMQQWEDTDQFAIAAVAKVYIRSCLLQTASSCRAVIHHVLLPRFCRNTLTLDISGSILYIQDQLHSKYIMHVP